MWVLLTCKAMTHCLISFFAPCPSWESTALNLHPWSVDQEICVVMALPVTKRMNTLLCWCASCVPCYLILHSSWNNPFLQIQGNLARYLGRTNYTHWMNNVLVHSLWHVITDWYLSVSHILTSIAKKHLLNGKKAMALYLWLVSLFIERNCTSGW